jgi:hypothetical protein
VVGVLTAWALLLAVAGAGKALRPGPTARALAAARIPGRTILARSPVVRITGAVEFLIGLSVMVVGGPIPAMLLAASYLLLGLVAWRMVRVSPGQDCGCFGRAAEPISSWHLVVDLAGAAVGLTGVIWPQPSTLQEISGQGAAGGILLAGLSILLAWLCYQVMTTLPALLEFRRKVAARR